MADDRAEEAMQSQREHPPCSLVTGRGPRGLGADDGGSTEHEALGNEALRTAIAEGQLRLWYQPIVSLDDDEVVGVEALVRWEHPECGLLPPAAFVPAAEQSDLIVDLGAWVIDEACRQAAEWSSRRHRLQVSVNVGARHVEDPGFATTVLAALRRHGLAPSSLCLEITEAVPVTASDAGLSRLRDLRRQGVRIALDDFGTGCSSLATLVRVEIDELKVDRLFVQGLEVDDHANHALVTAVLGLASSLGLDVVAEGIETASQLRELRALGCPFGQGYLYRRPLPPEELEAWMHRRSMDRSAARLESTSAAAAATLLGRSRSRRATAGGTFSRRGDRRGPTPLPAASPAASA